MLNLYYHHRNIIVKTMDIKCGLLFQNTCLKERSNMAVAQSLWVMLNLCKKYCSQLSQGMKNIHQSKLYQ